MTPSYNSYLFKLRARSALLLLLNRRKYKSFFEEYRSAFFQQNGFEVGGPSALFGSAILPVYQWANRVDGCNFSNHTLWEGAITDTAYQYSPTRSGRQFIADGTDLNEIAAGTYDFLVSAHCLEHIANPMKALEEWLRVLKPGGFMLLVVPDKNFTFDHNRNYTSFTHLLSDYESDTTEDDLTHLPEILALHDLKLDPGAGTDYAVFKKRSEANFTNRALHHHVFSQDVLRQCLEYFKVRVTAQYFVPPFHQVIIGQKSS